MPFIVLPEEQTAWSASWSDVRDYSDAAYDDGRLIITHPGETRPRPALTARASEAVVPVPTEAYTRASREAGSWGAGGREAYRELQPHLPPPADPFDKLPAGISRSKRKRLNRKRLRLAKTMPPSRQLQQLRSMVSSVCHNSRGSDGADYLRRVREDSRSAEQAIRLPSEGLWDFFLRKHGRGTRPDSLPAGLDVDGAFVGIELEFVPPLESLEPDEDPSSVLTEHPKVFGAEFHHDGSVRAGEEGDYRDFDGYNEAVILLRPPRWARLKRLCRSLLDAGCTVNATCGVHVHIDVRGYQDRLADLGKRVDILVSSLPVLGCFVPANRLRGERADRYCRFGVSPGLGDPSDHYHSYRYWAVNLCSVHRQGTVEVRMHHGSLDYDRVRAWTLLIRHILLDVAAPLLTAADARAACDALEIGWLTNQAVALTDTLIAQHRDRLERNSCDFGRYDPATKLFTAQAFSYARRAELAEPISPPEAPIERRLSAAPEPVRVVNPWYAEEDDDDIAVVTTAEATPVASPYWIQHHPVMPADGPHTSQAAAYAQMVAQYAAADVGTTAHIQMADDGSALRWADTGGRIISRLPPWARPATTEESTQPTTNP